VSPLDWLEVFGGSGQAGIEDMAVLGTQIDVCGEYGGTISIGGMQNTADARDGFAATLDGLGQVAEPATMWLTGGDDDACTAVAHRGAERLWAGTYTTALSGASFPNVAFPTAFLYPSGQTPSAFATADSAAQSVRHVGAYSDGDISVAGTYVESINLPGGATQPLNGQVTDEGFVVRYGGNDDWLVRLESAGATAARVHDASLNGDDFIAVVGGTAGEVHAHLDNIEVPPTGTAPFEKGGSDSFVAVVLADGTPQEVLQWGSGGDDVATAVDAEGQTIVATGWFHPMDGFNAAGTVVTGQGSKSMWVARLEEASSWVLQDVEARGSDGMTSDVSIEPQDIELDGADVYVAGTYTGFADFGLGTQTANDDEGDGFVVLYRGGLGRPNTSFSIVFGGKGKAVVTSVKVLGDGRVAVAGSFEGELTVEGRFFDGSAPVPIDGLDGPPRVSDGTDAFVAVIDPSEFLP
jgi:hypothetical protein